MAVNQSVYADYLDPAYPGMIANGETSNRISRTCEDAAGIGFGKAVFRGTDDHGCTATPGGQFLGITIANETLGLLAGQTADTYAQYSNVAILTLGAIWVIAGEDMADGSQAYVTAGGAIVDTASGNTILTGWFFDTTATSGNLVKIVKR